MQQQLQQMHIHNTQDSSRNVDRNFHDNTHTTQYQYLHNKSRHVDGNCQDTPFGDLPTEKHEDHLRIGFQNFNGLTGKLDDPVDRSLQDWVPENLFDVFGISEVNMYWPRVRRDLQFHERLHQWWQPGFCRAKHAYNRTEKRLKR